MKVFRDGVGIPYQGDNPPGAMGLKCDRKWR